MKVTTDTHGFLRGMEVSDSTGQRWIVVGVHAPTSMVGLKKSTWWRRLYWRLRRAIR